jgi:hypothetical protein
LRRTDVRYTSLSELGINTAKLSFKRVRVRERLNEVKRASEAAAKPGLDIANAKKALSDFYGVPVDAIEIVIRG